MDALTVGDIRPLLTLVSSSPVLNGSGSIASLLRDALAGFGAPITPELESTLSLIEANPILVDAGVAEFRSAIEGLPDSTLLTDVSGLGGTTTGTPTDGTETPMTDVTVTKDANGNDVQTFTLPFSGSTIAVAGDNVTVTLPGGQPQTLTGLERLEFTDGTLFLDVKDGAGLVKKAYDALLGRNAPDADGFDFWLNGVEAGTIDTFALTEAFSKSDGFAQQYGAVLNDFDALLEAFYQNLYGRAVDDAGKEFWKGFLEANGGAEAADETLAYMLQSEEFQALVGTSFANGIFV